MPWAALLHTRRPPGVSLWAEGGRTELGFLSVLSSLLPLGVGGLC